MEVEVVVYVLFYLVMEGDQEMETYEEGQKSRPLQFPIVLLFLQWLPLFSFVYRIVLLLVPPLPQK